MQSDRRSEVPVSAIIAHNLTSPITFVELKYLGITHGACVISCVDSGLGTDFYVGDPSDWQDMRFFTDSRSRLITKDGGLSYDGVLQAFSKAGKTPPLLLKEFGEMARGHGLTLFMEIPPLDDELADHVVQILARTTTASGHVLISRDANFLFQLLRLAPNQRSGIILAGDPPFGFIDTAIRQGIKYFLLSQWNVSARIAGCIKTNHWGAHNSRKICAFVAHTSVDMETIRRRFGPDTLIMTDVWRTLFHMPE